jgi:hypothetical protein
MGDDRHWGLLEDSQRPLLNAPGPLGVMRVELVGAFPELNSVGVWLGTMTDHARDRLDRAAVGDLVRQVLLAVGFTPDELTDLAVVPESESQETVERDYDGSWYYATR